MNRRTSDAIAAVASVLIGLGWLISRAGNAIAIHANRHRKEPTS